MNGFGFPILLCLCCAFVPCDGRITSPTEGTNVTFIPGSTGNLTWIFDDNVSALILRSWYFARRGGSKTELLGTIVRDGDPDPVPSSLSGVEIKSPATLLLNNVNPSFNGEYQFQMTVSVGGIITPVGIIVFIAKKPDATVLCNSSITLNEGDDVTCECRGVGGNPPADVTWYKDGVQTGGTKKENNTLTLKNVDETDSGIYTCLARSYPDPEYEDNETVVVRVNFKPKETSIKFSQNPAKLGGSVTIKCESRGFPEPKYNITLNGTKTVSTEKTYTITEVKWNDTGRYECTATNARGNDSASEFLDVTEQGATTPNPTSISPSNSKASPASNSATSSTVYTPTDSNGTSGTNIGLIIGIVIGVLVLIVIVAVLLYCYKSKDKDGRNCGNIDPAAGNHYELENEDAGPADNAYDSVGPVGTSSGKSKPPEKNTLPPVYAAVDKSNRQGNTLYASLDTDAMKPKRESKKEPERTPQTEYASIDFAKRADDNVPKADLV